MGISANYDRTKNSLRNSFVAVGLQLVALLIGFWSRRIFLNHLGTEVLGLNTTAVSIFQLLSLAELGIGSAIFVTLYKPVADGDRKAIREIIALQGWLYRIVAFIIIAASLVLMLFFPLIFGKTELPSWYAYASFGVLLYSAVLGYFFNYKQVLLDVSQKNYKVQLSVKLTSILKLSAQALAVKFLDNGYVWWLILEAVFATVTSLVLGRTVRKDFPYMSEKVEHPSALRLRYPSVTTKVKQVFVHRLGSLVVNQAMPLIIYAFASLTLVAKYGNYLIFTNNLNFILAACFMGLTASVGNMLTQNDSALTMKVFRELYSIRFMMTAVCCICLWILVDPFIRVWIGEEYILDRSTLLLITAVFYIYNSKSVVETYLNAHGMFQDIWAPIVEAALCLGLSVLLGRFYGLNGILSGMLVSEFLIIKVWKPVFLFSRGLHRPYSEYVRITAKHVAVGAVSLAATVGIASLLEIDPSASFGNFFIYAGVIFAFAVLMVFGLLYVSEEGMRNFVRRMFAVIST